MVDMHPKEFKATGLQHVGSHADAGSNVKRSNQTRLLLRTAARSQREPCAVKEALPTVWPSAMKASSAGVAVGGSSSLSTSRAVTVMT